MDKCKQKSHKNVARYKMFLTAISCDMPRSVSSLLMVNNYYVAAIKCDIGDCGGCGVVVVVCCFWFLMVNDGDGDGDSNDVA